MTRKTKILVVSIALVLLILPSLGALWHYGFLQAIYYGAQENATRIVLKEIADNPDIEVYKYPAKTTANADGTYSVEVVVRLLWYRSRWPFGPPPSFKRQTYTVEQGVITQAVDSAYRASADELRRNDPPKPR